MKFRISLLIILFASLSWSAKAEDRSFQAGDWSGIPRGEDDPKRGCIVMRPIDKQTYFVVYMNQSGDFMVGMTDLSWNQPNNSDYYGAVAFDEAAPIVLSGRAVNPKVIMFSAPYLSNSDQELQMLLQTSRSLKMSVGPVWIAVDLTGASRAIEMMKGCAEDEFRKSKSNSGQNLSWRPLSELGRRDRSYVKLDEEESIKDIRVASARLKMSTPEGDFDALFVSHDNTNFCGSGGCLLQIMLDQDDGSMKEILSVTASDVDLGDLYTNGMKNIRFGNGSVTLAWNGTKYEVR